MTRNTFDGAIDMESLIITAAITGAATVPALTPHLPWKPLDIADSAVDAQLVEKGRRMGEEMGRSAASPAEARLKAKRVSENLRTVRIELF
jgi:uncharacterized protein (DUF849 family)